MKIRAFRGMGDEVEASRSVLESVYDLRPDIDLREDEEASKFLEVPRSQVNALRYIDYLRRDVEGGTFLIALTRLDLFVPGLNYCFGVAMEPVAIVSTYRLSIDADRERYSLRLKKEVSHEFGHLLGLNHCKDPSCVMYFSNSIKDTDNKDYRPCKSCMKRVVDSLTLRLRFVT